MTPLCGLPERVTSRIEQAEGCWTWTGWHNDLGYGYVSWEGRDRPVHRVLLGLIQGQPIPAHLDVDHLCRNPGCCNPEHLEAVTRQVNLKRGKVGSKMSCKFGHDWSIPGNVYYRPDTGTRMCGVCSRQRGKMNRARYAR